MTPQTFKSLRNDESSDLFWEKVTRRAMTVGVDEPQMPQHRKQPRSMTMACLQVTFIRHLKHIIGNATLRQLISLSIVFRIDSISLDTESTIHWKSC